MKGKYGDKVVFDLVGPFEDEYKDIVENLADDGVVVFHGFQSDPKPYYAMSHCVVLPSYHEGMSNVLLEAASTGRALITTDIPGCREAVDDEITGYLCKKMDSISLEECMERFLSLNTASRREMGMRGRRKMEKEFDKSAVVQNTVVNIMSGI
jgi:galacturonosyltransferase